MVTVPNADRWSVFVRGGRAPRRRRHRRARTQRRTSSPPRLEKRQAQGGGVSGNSVPKTADFVADFVIVGAGVMGASIAFQLARRKAGSIAIIDKDHVASGGSSRSSALVRMHYSFPPEVQMALISLKMFQHWREIVGEEGAFRKTGFVRIVHPNESERLKKNVEMQRALGAKVELIDQRQLREL